MSCPEPTSIQTYCLGVQLSEVCPDPTANVTIAVSLVNPDGGRVVDPSNCALVPTGQIYFQEIEADDFDGCICTCPLLPNQAADPDEALQPSSTYYRIVVTSDSRVVLDTLFQLNAETAAAAGTQTFSCGECLDLCALLPDLPTDPPTALFCEAVEACLTPDSLAGPVGGVLTHTPINGGTPTTHNLISGDANNAITAGSDGALHAIDTNTTYDLDPTIDQATGTASLRGSDGSIDPLLLLSQDADQIIGYGADGGLHLDCDDVLTCVNVAYVDQDATHVAGPAQGSGTAADPIQVPLCCPEFTYVPWDPATHDAGVVEGSGTAADPYQIPLPTTSVEIESIEATNTVTNPDGSTTITYTITETDDGDADPPTHTFDITIPAAAELNFTYVPFDAATHDAGVIEGTGTAADPWQIPLPDCLCNVEYVAYDPAVHTAGAVVGDGSVGSPFQVPLPTELCDQITAIAAATQDLAATDEVVVIQTDGTCARRTVAAGANTTYDLSPLIDQATGAITLTGSDTTMDPALILSQDAGQLIGYGGDGGLYLDCDAVLACPTFEYVPFDAATHDAGVIEGTGTAADPWQIPLPEAAGAALVLEYVPFDAATHDPGAVEGAGTAADPIQVPLPEDVCATIAGLPAAAECDDAVSVVTADCELISLDNIRPAHVLGSCSTPPFTVDDNIGTGGGTPQSLTMTRVLTDQEGQEVIGQPTADDAIPDTAFPKTYNVTPSSATNSVFFVQVSWSDAGRDDALAGASTTMTSTGSLDPPTQLDRSTFWSGTYYKEVWAVDANGTGASTITVDHPDRGDPGPDGNHDGVWMLEIYEVVGVNPLSAADFAAPVSTVTPFDENTQDSTMRLGPDQSIDTGECDALYFGAARHVIGNPAVPNLTLNADAIWSVPDNAAVNEVSELASIDSDFRCQGGTVAGIIPGGSGPVGFSYDPNGAAPATTSQPDGRSRHDAFALSSCAATGGGAGTTTVDGCSLDVTNPACNPDTVQQVRIEGGVQFTIADGSHWIVTPRINGTLQSSKAVEINNQSGATIVQSIPLSCSSTLAGTIAPGAAAPTLTVNFLVERVTAGAGSAIDEVLVKEFEVETELVHV